MLFMIKAFIFQIFSSDYWLSSQKTLGPWSWLHICFVKRTSENPSDWLKQISQAVRPIRSSAQRCHQYGISALVSQTSFRGETVGGVAKCCLLSQATWKENDIKIEKNLYTIFTAINFHSHWNMAMPSFRVETNNSSKDSCARMKEMFDHCSSITVAKEHLQKNQSSSNKWTNVTFSH